MYLACSLKSSAFGMPVCTNVDEYLAILILNRGLGISCTEYTGGKAEEAGVTQSS
jgi:hypothetical protein